LTAQALRLARLSSAPVVLRELTSDVTAEQAARSPEPGEWSIGEPSATHIADHDVEHLAQMAQARAMTRAMAG
jgi:hypothetical protein